MKLSIIVPTRNRAKVLEKALDSIANQTLSKNLFEVIVVDNGSTDETKTMVDSFAGKIENLVYIYDDTPGLHIGRHRGLLASKSDILVYTDDDTEATPTWLEGIMESFKDEKVALVGGKNLPNFESNPPAWVQKEWGKESPNKVLGALSILDFGDGIKEISPYYVFGCNFSIRKNILFEAGGFHPDGMPQEIIKYRGDGETHVSEYILEKKYKTIYNPKASVYHLCSKDRMTKEYFTKRYYNQGISDSYNAIRNNKKISLTKRKIKSIVNKYLLGKDVARERAYLDGFTYHQNVVKQDSLLLEWVKRDSYIYNGSIPQDAK
ncbi:glycosyltransferase [Patescibacteria group bacterium]|nr:glycosyltransferase [Patescibacteria group bacterium]MBU1727896.1 glycosyltransferase [Patescibacteria group bacterium]